MSLENIHPKQCLMCRDIQSVGILAQGISGVAPNLVCNGAC